jgi:hypothetical protein
MCIINSLCVQYENNFDNKHMTIFHSCLNSQKRLCKLEMELVRGP